MWRSPGRGPSTTYDCGTRITEVDERDSCWEDHSALLPDLRFDAGREGSHGTATYDIAEADVLQVNDWARRQAGVDGLCAVALIGEANDDVDAMRANRDLTWLISADANDVPPYGDAHAHLMHRMRHRQGSGT